MIVIEQQGNVIRYADNSVSVNGKMYYFSTVEGAVLFFNLKKDD